MELINDKVAIVAGAGSGMVREEAVLIAQKNAKVIATNINEPAVHAVIQEIVDAGGEAIAYKQDVVLEEKEEEEWVQMVNLTIQNYASTIF